MGTHKFEFVRHDLKKMGLLSNDKLNQSKTCVKNGYYHTCSLCAITQICAVKVPSKSIEMFYKLVFQNPVTGLVEETFKTPYSNEQHKIGGNALVDIKC